MAFLIRNLLNIYIFHGSIIILIANKLHILCIFSIFWTYKCYFHYYKCWGTDCFCGQTVT